QADRDEMAAPRLCRRLCRARREARLRGAVRAPSLRANGSRERAPDDRLRDAIQGPRRKTGLLRRFAPRNDGDGLRHDDWMRLLPQKSKGGPEPAVSIIPLFGSPGGAERSTRA